MPGCVVGADFLMLSPTGFVPNLSSLFSSLKVRLRPTSDESTGTNDSAFTSPLGPQCHPFPPHLFSMIKMASLQTLDEAGPLSLSSIAVLSPHHSSSPTNTRSEENWAFRPFIVLILNPECIHFQSSSMRV